MDKKHRGTSRFSNHVFPSELYAVTAGVLIIPTTSKSEADISSIYQDQTLGLDKTHLGEPELWF